MAAVGRVPAGIKARARRSGCRNVLAEATLSFARFLEEATMLRWAVIFLILGLVAGVLGFTAIAGASIAIAKFLFFLFIAIFLVLLVLGMTAARRITGR
jgi:uncharacterized membrane protein YtjA (UPF0391 family)